MYKSIVTLLTFVLALSQPTNYVNAQNTRSWTRCINFHDGICQGFPRAHPDRMYDISRLYTHKSFTYMPPSRSLEAPICDPQLQTKTIYDDKITMNAIRSGESLTFAWKHHRRSQITAPGKAVSVYCFPPGKRNMKRGDMIQHATLMGSFNSTEGCTAQMKTDEPLVNCQADVRFTKPTEYHEDIMSCAWVWPHDELSNGEEYATCFDVKVSSNTRLVKRAESDSSSTNESTLVTSPSVSESGTKSIATPVTESNTESESESISTSEPIAAQDAVPTVISEPIKATTESNTVSPASTVANAIADSTKLLVGIASVPVPRVYGIPSKTGVTSIPKPIVVNQPSIPQGYTYKRLCVRGVCRWYKVSTATRPSRK